MLPKQVPVNDKSLPELQQESLDAIVRCVGFGQTSDDLADVLIMFHERLNRLEKAQEAKPHE